MDAAARRSINELLGELATAPEGLAEADARRRLQIGGANELEPPPRRTFVCCAHRPPRPATVIAYLGLVAAMKGRLLGHVAR
jgi:hypothetical protein